MSKHFMREPKENRALISVNDGGLFVHYPETCEVNSDPERVIDPLSSFGLLANHVRLYPSPKGWVAVMYEKKGLITFYVQLSEKRAAWQRIPWDPDFDMNWDHNKVKDAISKFLCVADCEEQEKNSSKVR